MKSLEERKAFRNKQKVANAQGSDAQNRGDGDADGDGQPDLLQGNVASITEGMADMDVAQLDALLVREVEGKNRTGVKDAIAKAKANLSGAGAGWNNNG